MKDFKIINSFDESSYLTDGYAVHVKEWSRHISEKYYLEHIEGLKNLFLNELKSTTQQSSELKIYRGIPIILVCENTADGDFTDHSIKKTYLSAEDDKVIDINDYKNLYDESGYLIKKIYYVLPDNKLIEYNLTQSYEDELSNIYKVIIRVKSYYKLNAELERKEDTPKYKI